MMLNKRENIIYFICFVLLGLIISVQFRSVLIINKQKVLVSQEVEKLKSQLETQLIKNENLQNYNDELESKKNEIIEKSKNTLHEERINELIKERARLQVISGLTDIKGEGIEITLNDGVRSPSIIDIREIIIHDKDLLKVVNELHKAGAQAISINNERIMSTTKIICAGPAIKINNERCAVPFIINAIGDSDKLYNSVLSSSIIKELLLYNLKISVIKSKDLVVKKYILLN